MTGDPELRNNQNPVSPPVAGVIYLSVPFHYDAKRPVRKKILEKYYGSPDESMWGVCFNSSTILGHVYNN